MDQSEFYGLLTKGLDLPEFVAARDLLKELNAEKQR
jgi:hypothetical protein